MKINKTNKNLIYICILIILLMFILSYFSVPLYTLFCNVTGFAGTIKRNWKNSNIINDKLVKVKFDSITDIKLPWIFKPVLNEININLGETIQIMYTVKNLSNKITIGEAIYNVSPHLIGKYFNKIQCFCFTKIILNSFEELKLPVIFYLDPAINKNKDISKIKDITLSYTMNKIYNE